MRRESVDTYPSFSRKVSCLVLILSESCNSRLGLGFDQKRKIGVISGNPERFSGETLAMP